MDFPALCAQACDAQFICVDDHGPRPSFIQGERFMGGDEKESYRKLLKKWSARGVNVYKPEATLARSDEIWGMLRPTESSLRRTISLDGIWSFYPHVDETSKSIGAPTGHQETDIQRVQIAVPGSWNEQLPELDAFMGPAWSEREFWVPAGFDPRKQRCVLRFGSVNYKCIVFVDGHTAGEHEANLTPVSPFFTPHFSIHHRHLCFSISRAGGAPAF